jgi:hypothetical protein
LWTAGENAGIYATGTIVGDSFMRDREEWEPADAPPESRAIRYRLERILVDQPVLRRDLVSHPVLKVGPTDLWPVLVAGPVLLRLARRHVRTRGDDT